MTFASTCSLLGANASTVSESSVLNPVPPYVAKKSRLDRSVLSTQARGLGHRSRTKTMTNMRQNAILFGEEEINAAIEVLKCGQVTMGDRCLEFEEAFANYMGVGDAVFVNSGSSANLLIFFAMANPALPNKSGQRRFTPGCEVIVPAVTWSTTVWPIVQAGGVPVIVDVD